MKWLFSDLNLIVMSEVLYGRYRGCRNIYTVCAYYRFMSIKGMDELSCHVNISIHTFSLRDSQLDGVELLARDIELETPIASFDGVRPILSDEISFFRGDAFEEIGLLGVISA